MMNLNKTKITVHVQFQFMQHKTETEMTVNGIIL